MRIALTTVVALSLAGLAAASSAVEECNCRRATFDQCLTLLGAQNAGYCSSYQCPGWICDETAADLCEIKEAVFPILNTSGRPNSQGNLPCSVQWVKYAEPKWASAVTPVFLQWSYDGHSGPEYWGLRYPDCNKNAQSPIDFRPFQGGNVQQLPANLPGTLNTLIVATQAANYSISQSHGSPMYTCKSAICNNLVWNNLTYKLIQFHVHAPAEHTLDGIHFPFEVHFVHRNNATNTLAVIAAWFDTSSATDNPAIETLFGNGHMEDVDDVVTIPNFQVSSLLNMSSTFFTYSGSLTTPPCTEITTFFVSTSVMKMSDAQYQAYWDHIGGYPGNSRPVQDLNGRVIRLRF